MATEAQIRANRRNALRSTGPRTPEGKARSSRNHLVHGLTATGLLDHESPDLLTAIHEDFRRDFDPQTSVEEVLVERMALAYFRLGRFSHIEADLLQREEAEPTHEQLHEKYGHDENKLRYIWNARQYGRVTRSYLANQKTLHRLSLYEVRLQRDFDRALRDLQRLQRERPPAAAEPAPQPPAKPPQSETLSPPPAPAQPLHTPSPANASPNSGPLTATRYNRFNGIGLRWEECAGYRRSERNRVGRGARHGRRRSPRRHRRSRERAAV